MSTACHNVHSLHMLLSVCATQEQNASTCMAWVNKKKLKKKRRFFHCVLFYCFLHFLFQCHFLVQCYPPQTNTDILHNHSLCVCSVSVSAKCISTSCRAFWDPNFPPTFLADIQVNLSIIYRRRNLLNVSNSSDFCDLFYFILMNTVRTQFSVTLQLPLLSTWLN